MSTPHAPSAQPSISVTTLSQYVRLRSCDRFLRFRLRPDEEKALRRRWNLTIQPLTPLLQESGEAFEKKVEAALEHGPAAVLQVEEDDYAALGRWLREITPDPVILLQVPLEARLGDYPCHGVADVIRLHRREAGAVDVTIADIKSSRKVRMEHRLQVATYAYLVQQIARAEGVELGHLEGRVLHAGDGEEVPTLEGEDNRFDLDTYVHVLERLALEPGCTLERIAQGRFEDAAYHLGYWCDGCLYNALCMYDSAERRDLSLVPYLSAVEKRTLHKHGVDTIEALAGLMQLPENGTYELTPAPGKEDRVRELSQDWPLGPTLPVLVQRARGALRPFDRSVDSRPFLYGAGFGTLPDDEAHDGLVKVFLDVQHDYLQDRLYLLAALVAGPRGERVIARATDGPPTEDAERTLLTAWVQAVLDALLDVAESPEAYLHLYLYDALDQRVLLEGLKRHLDAVADVPGFFDLMTQSPALDQPILSFLAHELRERKNLGLVCAPLHDAARTLGFDWQDDQYAYYDRFRARLFDNRRDVLCTAEGRLIPRPAGVPRSDPRVLRIESASRFNSQIPLEYAYGAWGHFAASQDDLLAPFQAADQDLLEAFAGHRVRALAHIEQRIKPKSRYLNKKPCDLSSLRGDDVPRPTLARSLEEFLFMEHHAALQERLQRYALPIDRRVQTGEALLMRYVGAGDGETHRFEVAFDVLGLDPDLTMKTFRHKEGSWMVLNPAGEERSANQIKHGSLAVIEALEPRHLVLATRWINARGAKFKYYHPRLDLEEGALYTLDAMADDLNADKALEALENALHNTLYWWLLQPPTPRERTEDEKQFAEDFARYVDVLEQPRALTPPQRDVVRSLPGERVLLVQGPPGTGKSHTLAWAVFARLLEHARRGQPFRVVVSCKTHKAILVAMRSVLEKWEHLQARPTETVKQLSFRGLLLAKMGGDAEGEAWPDGLAMIDPYREKGRLDDYLARDYVVLGATPGYLYNLGKYRGRDRGVDWRQKPFDLLVIDEASQMSVPEAVLAGAFLKKDGAVLVVGDHRQMPPIIAHDWEREEKRTAKAAEPYLSLFEYLFARGFPRLSLDQSFRLNVRLAEFLAENIYRQDDIAFFSTRTDQLAVCPHVDAYVDAVLDPTYPIVFVEHDETAAQQYNELELELVAPVVSACQRHLALDGADGLGVVVPHRAQRALLQERFARLSTYEAIDTVERFQGGERDVIIVSATASDPDFVLAEADFLLDPNRLNVAISRPRKKLVVVASRSITGLLTSDLETFEQALVWKRLYHRCTSETLWAGQIQGHAVRVRGCPA